VMKRDEFVEQQKVIRASLPAAPPPSPRQAR